LTTKTRRENYIPRDFADWREVPSETLERKEIREKLVEALESLGQIYRDVFVLRDMQHLSIDETAKTLGISIASVKTRLLRARLMLRDLLAPGLAVPGAQDAFCEGGQAMVVNCEQSGRRSPTISKMTSIRICVLPWRRTFGSVSAADRC